MSKKYITDNITISAALNDGAGVGTSGQVLSSTGTGVSWIDGSGIVGGPYLPLAGGTLTGDLTINDTVNDASLTLFSKTGNDSFVRFGDQANTRGWIGYDSSKGLMKLNVGATWGTVDHFTLDTSGNATIAGTINSGAITSTGFVKATGNLPTTGGMSDTGIGLGHSSSYAHAQFSGSTGGYIDFAEPNVDWSGRIIYTHSTDEMKFYTAATEVLKLDSSNNATFAGTINSGAITSTGNIVASSNSATIGTPKIIMQSDGTLDWGAARDYGTLTWDTGLAIVKSLTGKGLQFRTNGNQIALTIDTSQNAAFISKATSAATLAADGVSTLTTKSYVDGLVTGVPVYIGTWNASTNSPDLTLAANKVLGNYYIVDTAGTSAPNGAATEPDSWNVGDWAIFSDITSGAGTDLWQKIDNTSVISGSGTGEKMVKWAGASGANSETLTDSSITDTGSAVTIDSATILNGQVNINPDSDSGLYIANAGANAISLLANTGDELYLGSNNSYSLRFKTNLDSVFENGNVGIGTSSPDAKLHIESTSATGANFILETTNAGGIPLLDLKGAHSAQLRYKDENDVIQGRVDFGDSGIFNFIDVPNNSSTLYLKSGGNVGIGTTSPNFKLHVDGSALFDTDTGSNPFYIARNASTSESLKIYVDDSSAVFESIQDETGSSHGSFKFIMDAGSPSAYTTFLHGTDERVRIEAGGNVGIGQISPAYKLDVSGTGRFTDNLTVETNIFLYGAGGTGVLMNTINTGGIVVSGGNSTADGANLSLGGSAGNNDLRMRIGSSEKFRVNSGGNVSIGNTNNAYKLDVSGTINSSTLLVNQVDQNSYARYSSPDNEVSFVRTVASNSATQWFKIITYNGSSRRIKLGIVSGGDNTNTLDEYLISASGYGMPMHILRYPGSRYNTSKLVGVLAVNPSNGGTQEVWINLLGMTGTDGTTTITANTAIEASATILTSATTTKPSVTSNDAELTISTDNRNYTTIMGSGGATFGGDVGIGTSSPSYALSAVKSVSGDWLAQLSNTYNGNGNGVLIDAGNGTLGEILRLRTYGGTTRVSFMSTGNVGIGTTSPDRQLEVESGSGGILRLSSSVGSETIGNNIGKIEFYTNDADGPRVGGFIQVTAQETFGRKNDMRFAVSSSNNTTAAEAMRINSSGNVGIGVTAPTSKLHINQVVTDPNLDMPSSFAVEIDSNHSGSATIVGTDREQGGLFIDVDSSTSGGGTSDEHRLYGIYNAVNHSGDSDMVQGSYNRVEQNTTYGTTTWLRAVEGSAISDGGTGAVMGNIVGVYGVTSLQDATPVSNSYGGSFLNNSISNRTGTTTNAFGIRSEIDIASTTGFTSLFAAHFSIDSNAAYTANNAYLLYLEYAGTSLATNTYAIYSPDDVDSYHAGNFGIGTNSPVKKLQVSGTATGDLMNILCVNTHDTNGDTASIGFSMTDNDLYNKAAVIFERTGNQGVGSLHLATNSVVSSANVTKADARLTVTSSGNIGIGTTAPGSPLTVEYNNLVSNHTPAVLLKSKNSLAGSGDVLDVFTQRSDGFTDGYIARFGNLVSTKMYIRGDGNVGIGTTAPDSKIQVEAKNASNVIYGGFRIGYNATSTNYLDGDTQYFRNGLGTLTRMTVGSYGSTTYGVGQFGNGTSTDLYFIEGVRQSVGVTLRIYDNANNVYYDTYKSMIVRANQNGGSGGYIGLHGGAVGINTSSPSAKLDIVGDGTNYALEVNNTSTGDAIKINTANATGNNGVYWSQGSVTLFNLFSTTGNDTRLRLGNAAGTKIHLSTDAASYFVGGGVGIATTTPGTDYSLVVATIVGQVGSIEGQGSMKVTSGALGVNVTPSGTAGRIDASNDIVAYSSSDERLKENIKPIENATEKVKQLTGVEFDWKQEFKDAHGHEGHDTGVIAQQVLEVMPTAVRENDNGYLAVRYEKLIGLLIESNKELSARIEKLESK